MSRPQSHRLAAGGQIDRQRPLAFQCNGRAYTGYAGDTLASALLANGVRVVGRSFKFHRPRGVFSAGVEECNALLRVDAAGLSAPLVRATLQPLVDGLVARTENAWPSVDLDVGRWLDLTHGLWPAGFYHKTFKWPRWGWYEPFIRHCTGSGRVPQDPDPTCYVQQSLHCDVLVIGSGPAGLAAACTAARSGARVVLAELESRLGGSLLFEGGEIDGRAAPQWLSERVAELEAARNVRILKSTTVASVYDHGAFLAVDRSEVSTGTRPVERAWRLRARQAVLAAGAIEQPLVFEHNDRPGILLAGAVRRYLRQYAVTVGRRVAVATNNDDAYRTAFALREQGIEVPLLVDARANPAPRLLDEARRRGLEVVTNAVVTGTAGTRGLRRIEVGTLAGDGRSLVGGRRVLDCDALAMSGGWSPAVHLHSQAGGRLRYDDASGCFVPATPLPNLRAAGAAKGCFGLASALRDGGEAGAAAAIAAGFAVKAAVPSAVGDEPWTLRPIRRAPGGRSSRQWIDFRHDATTADIELAVRENYVSVEHLKRYTTIGMSVDQGKTSNLNALSYLAELTGRGIAETGTTTYRPVYAPVSLGAIAAGHAGALYSPTRRLPAEPGHLASGAVLEEFGGWQRPAYFARPGETRDEAIAREVRAVRSAVGLFDASPLGKIEVMGPDAAEFLDRIYLNNVKSLPLGRVRYGLMLNENGIVIDDGVFVRMAADHFLVCPTSGGADRIAAWLEEWHQCEWPDLRLVMAPVTTQWAVLTLAGPRARELLRSLESDIDFSPVALPHLSFTSGRLAGLPVRVQRVSFTGEASFELSVPARSAEAMHAALMRAGSAFGLVPFGVEALLVLRMEKGYLHVGVDTDGTTNPFDVGFGAVVDRKPGDFVGRRSLQRAHDRRADRRQLVGLESCAASGGFVAGAHIVTRTGDRSRSEGFVTSACLSPTLGRPIGLGLLEGGLRRKGEIVTVCDEGRECQARVVDATFYDPQGTRLHG